MADAHATTKAIVRRVRELRNRLGISAQELADRLAAQGIPWDRSIVAKVETGHRQNITVVELLGLARALHVAPIHLLVPPSNEGTFHVTPQEACPPGDARAWIRGQRALPGTDRRIFCTEVPLDELGGSS